MTSVIGLVQRWLKNDANFETITASQKIEEEIHNVSMKRYYPIRIGEVLNTKYQVVGKLGFGLGSTVCLANDL
jgi:serine/threonine-protein kinase SRPK3